MLRIAGRRGCVSHAARLVRDAGATTPLPSRACSSLIPDSEGKVGQITVTNRTGTQVLDQPHQASTVQSADDAPSPPSTLEETEIKRIFGEALAAQPAGARTVHPLFQR